MWIVVLLALVGCGGGDNESSGTPKKPDTGYGKAQPVPAPPTCVDLCNRLGDCAMTLCDEDTHSTRYEGTSTFIADECEAGCTDDKLKAITQAQWQCFFVDSCRQVFDYDSCQAQASYFCQ
jgi:hypothetical protein